MWGASLLAGQGRYGPDKNCFSGGDLRRALNKGAAQ